MSWNLPEAISYYRNLGAPRDQTALVGLLREIQQENGNQIPSYLIKIIAEEYAVKETFLLAIIKRIPSLRLSDTHCLELCAGPNCGKHAELAVYAETLHKEHPNFELKYVPCMRMCGKGPNIKWDGILYHKADTALIQQLVESSR